MTATRLTHVRQNSWFAWPEYLSDYGLRPTPARNAVFKVLQTLSAPLSAKQIFNAVAHKRVEESINRVTVYRVLEKMVEAGVVQKLCGFDRTFRFFAQLLLSSYIF